MIRMSLIMIFSIYGCVEYKCYPNIREGIKKANNFCIQFKDDKNMCNKVALYDKNMCTFVDEKKICEPIGENINTIVWIPSADCQNGTEQNCKANPNCEWTF